MRIMLKPLIVIGAEVIEFKTIDGQTAKEKECFDFVCKTASETKALNNLVKVGQAHLKK